MADADRKPVVSVHPQYLVAAEVVERAPAERPKHDTIDTILDWLADPGRHMPSLVSGFDEFAWRMLAAGSPLLRTTLHVRTLHPQYLGASLVWWRTTGRTVTNLVAHDVEELFAHATNPAWRVATGEDFHP